MSLRLNESPSFTNLRKLKALYGKTFPREEKKPFSLMVQKRNEGLMEFLTVEDENGTFLGFIITVLHKDIVLLDYFAVAPKQRGNGIGAEALKLLRERCRGKRILLEIEDPEEPAKNTEERLRRKAFYLRNGLEIMEYKVWLFGVKMLVLTVGGAVPFEEYHEIFGAVFSSYASQNVTLAE